jgi:Glycosyltransferase
MTLLDFSSIEEKGLYTDLIREFLNENHKVYIISPSEKRKKEPTRIIDYGNCKILKLQIGNIQKTNILEKGITTLLIESKFKKALKKYFSDIKFDLILYSTPPITIYHPIKYIKKRDNAKAYLLLKDIFPQNAVDIGILKNQGVKGLIYECFRYKEKKLYKLSDYIGCMSKANVDYIIKHNRDIDGNKVEVCPNCTEPVSVNESENLKYQTKLQYNLPLNKTLFVYGGNLGKPQGVDFLIDCIKLNELNESTYFIIIGAGTEYKKIEDYFENDKPQHAILLQFMPKDEFDHIISACDVGMIFLDHRFTIPNFPSRLLSYMQASLPVIAATDTSTDLGKIIMNEKIGYWCESSNPYEFNKLVNELNDEKIRKTFGINARKFMEANYDSRQSYEIIMKHF